MSPIPDLPYAHERAEVLDQIATWGAVAPDYFHLYTLERAASSDPNIEQWMVDNKIRDKIGKA